MDYLQTSDFQQTLPENISIPVVNTVTAPPTIVTSSTTEPTFSTTEPKSSTTEEPTFSTTEEPTDLRVIIIVI